MAALVCGVSQNLATAQVGFGALVVLWCFGGGDATHIVLGLSVGARLHEHRHSPLVPQPRCAVHRRVPILQTRREYLSNL